MHAVNFKQSFFELFQLPEKFTLDMELLSEQYLRVQKSLHPDRFSAADAHEQRVAVQYSSLVNEAFSTLRQPLSRARYLLLRAGFSAEAVAATKVDGGFLIQQMELREKLESIGDLVDPDTVLDHLLEEISRDVAVLEAEVTKTLDCQDYGSSAVLVVKMQYLDKLRDEAEQLLAQLHD